MGSNFSSESAQGSESSFMSHLEDFAGGLFLSAVENPYNGIVQIVDHVASAHIPPLDLVHPHADTLSTKAGELVGTIADVALIATGIGAAAGSAGLGTSILGAALRAGATGAVLGLVSPVSDSQNFWRAKAQSIAVDTGTFAIMGGLASGLSGTSTAARLALQGIPGRLAVGTGIGAIAGFGGGVGGSIIGDIAYKKPFNTIDTLKTGAYYSAFGGIFGGAEVLLQSGLKAYSERNEPVRYDEQGRIVQLPDLKDRPIKIKYDEQGNVVRVNLKDWYPTTGNYLDKPSLSDFGDMTMTKSVDPSTGDAHWAITGKTGFFQKASNFEVNYEPVTIDADGKGITFKHLDETMNVYNDGQSFPTSAARSRMEPDVHAEDTHKVGQFDWFITRNYRPGATDYPATHWFHTGMRSLQP